MKASPAVLYARSETGSLEPVAFCGTDEAPRLEQAELIAGLEAGQPASLGDAALLPLADHQGLCGLLLLEEGSPAEDAEAVWELCRNFLCIRIRAAMGKNEEPTLPDTESIRDSLKLGLAVTGGILQWSGICQNIEKAGQPAVPEVVRAQVLEALRELHGPRDACGVTKDGHIWLFVVTATPPDTDLLALTMADAIAERLPLGIREIQTKLRLEPLGDIAAAAAFFSR